MAKLIRPELFSAHFGLSAAAVEKAGFVDPILNCDTKLFIDPLLIPTSGHEAIRERGNELLRERFSQIVKLTAASKAEGDVAWRNASRLLSLDERPETCLGYGGSGTSGSSRPDSIRNRVIATAKEVVTLGEDDPSIISLMGLFEEDIGPDTISDLSTTVLMPVLCALTSDFCKTHGVRTRHFPKHPNTPLPLNPFRKDTPVVLVPQDIVRHLPLAADWEDVPRVVGEIASIRGAFNAYVGNIAEATITDMKKALRKAALASLSNFRDLFEAFMNSSNHYDSNVDIFNFYAFRKVLASDPAAFKGKIKPPAVTDGKELRRIVDEIVVHFRRLVENNNLWEMMWNDRRPKRERASQLLFFAIAEMFCKTNDIDISPEANMGGGPVDFKFSKGYANRVLVEIKLSTGQVVHGYEKQLEVYKTASGTDSAILLVVDIGKMGKKLTTIQKRRELRLSHGERASDIEVVDAKRRASASKSN